jgi:hypothetical protein
MRTLFDDLWRAEEKKFNPPRIQERPPSFLDKYMEKIQNWIGMFFFTNMK